MTKVLIIRFRRVGDAVISSSLCTSLKHTFPDSEIHYVLNESIAPLFENHPDIDKVIAFSDDDMHNFVRYVKKVKQIVSEEKYDIIIDTRSTVKTMFFPLFSLRTPFRIGRKKMYNPFIHNFRVDNKFKGDKDNVELTLSLLDPLERSFQLQKENMFRLYFTEEEKLNFANYMQQQGVDLSKPIITCAVTARLEHKIWAVEKMKDILGRILDKYDVQLVFNYGGDKEKAFAERLHSEMNNHDRIFVNIEAKSLRELIAMLANSTFFFGNEGGPRHISQALDVPSFAIYPPGIPKDNWLPNKSERYQGIELFDIDPALSNAEGVSYEEKFRKIDVDSVWGKLDPMLEKFLPQN